MSNYVLIVDLEIRPEGIDTFLRAAKDQAEQSVQLEPGCLRFDVIQKLEEPHQITHYEIFENEAAFEAHTLTKHTQSFGKIIESLIVKVDMRRGQLGMSFSK